MADSVRAIVGLAKHPDASGKVYNVGSNEGVSIKKLDECIKIMAGSSPELVLVPYSKACQDPGFEGMERRKPDTRRVITLPSWNPESALEDMLERMISYVRDQRSNAAFARF